MTFQTATHRLVLNNNTEVFFNVRSNQTVKVVMRRIYNGVKEYPFIRVMSVGNARAAYAQYRNGTFVAINN